MSPASSSSMSSPSNDATDPTSPSPPPSTTTSKNKTTENPDPDAAAVHHHFRPFVRHSAPWTFYEVTKTIFITIFLLPVRLVVFLLICGAAYLLSTAILIGLDGKPGAEFIVLSPWRKVCVMLLGVLLRIAAVVCFGVFNVPIHRPQQPTNTDQNTIEEKGKAYVYVANHLGWLDILVLLSMYRSSFVAKGSLERVPIIGKVARAMQCLFVRENMSLTSSLKKRIIDTYACHKKRKECSGCCSCLNPLIIFPEGTTTNGTSMLAFRTGVFHASMPIQPILLKFPWKHWSPTWESIRFRQSLFRTMTQIRNYVEIIELPVYYPNQNECKDSALFANNIQNIMANAIKQEVVELNRKHKLIYHDFLRGQISPKEALRRSHAISEEDYLLQKRKEWAMQQSV